MSEEPIYLKSLHEYNFRHLKENPKVIGFVMYTPKGLNQRACYKVEYESDGKIDYIAFESVSRGQWQFDSNK